MWVVTEYLVLNFSSALTAALRSGKRCTKSGSTIGFASSRLMVATSEIQLHVAECISSWSGGHQNRSNQHEKSKTVWYLMDPHGLSFWIQHTLHNAGMFLETSSRPTASLKNIALECMRSSKLTVLQHLHRPLLNLPTWDFKPTRYFPTTARLSLPISPRSTLLLPRDSAYLCKVNQEIGEKVRKRKVCEDDYYDLTQKQLNWTRISWELFAVGTYIDLALPA